MAALDSNPAFITQLVGQVDVGEEVRSNGRQRLYLGFDFSLLNQFHLPQEHMFTLKVYIFNQVFLKGEKITELVVVFSLTSLRHSGCLVKYGLLRRLASLHSSLLVRGRRTFCGTHNLKHATLISPTRVCLEANTRVNLYKLQLNIHCKTVTATTCT